MLGPLITDVRRSEARWGPGTARQVPAGPVVKEWWRASLPRTASWAGRGGYQRDPEGHLISLGCGRRDNVWLSGNTLGRRQGSQGSEVGINRDRGGERSEPPQDRLGGREEINTDPEEARMTRAGPRRAH